MSGARIAIAGAVVGAALLGVGVWVLSGPSPAETGERLYRDGILGSGDTVTATVMGDVPVTGDQVLCTNCHGRSGMGAEETGTRTPPISGPFLFDRAYRATGPIYNDATLARALRDGVDPTGRSLDPLMPRYTLDDADIDVLTAYLRTLGTEPPPGADDETLRLATVIADDTPDAERRAVRAVIDAFIKDKNAEARNDGARAKERREEGRVIAPYRVWSHDVWALSGAPETWRAQLDGRYRKEPVFAMVGGVADGPWWPMHDFCEDHTMPCVLPSTDQPGTVGDDFYTVYYSGGLRLEAEIVAVDVADTRADTIVQFVAAGDAAAMAAATTLRDRIPNATPIVEVNTGDDPALVAAISGPGAVVLWLDRSIVTTIPDSAASTAGPPIYLSASLLDEGAASIPAGLRPRGRLITLFRTPLERDPGLRRFQLWAKLRGVDVTHERLQAQTWFAFMALLHSVKHTEKYLQRDYMIDTLDHASGLMAFLPLYPRGTVGPGQRFLAKGGQVIDLSGATEPRWIVP